DVADRRHSQQLAQLARRSAVVSAGHVRGDVNRLVLQPAQERGEPGPAADRDEPRPTREEPLLVDDLDERLVAVRRAEWVHERLDDLDRADDEEGEADRAEEDAPGDVPEELERHDVDEALERPADVRVAVQLAQGERAAE